MFYSDPLLIKELKKKTIKKDAPIESPLSILNTIFTYSQKLKNSSPSDDPPILKPDPIDPIEPSL